VPLVLWCSNSIESFSAVFYCLVLVCSEYPINPFSMQLSDCHVKGVEGLDVGSGRVLPLGFLVTLRLQRERSRAEAVESGG